MVTDRGIATEECLCRLRGQGYLYLVVSTWSSVANAPGTSTPNTPSTSVQQRTGTCIRTRACPTTAGRRVRTASPKGTRPWTAPSPGASKARPHRTLREACRAPRPETDRTGPATHQAAQGPKPGARPALRLTVDTDRTARHRHPLPPTAAAGFDGGPSHPGVYRLHTNRTDWDEATPWRTHITPTTSRRSSAPRIRPASDPSPQAHPRRVPSVHHRHRPPTRAGDPHPSASGRSPRRLGPPSAGSSQAGNASPPLSDVTTNAPCTCARRPGCKATRAEAPRLATTPWHPSCPGGPQ